MANELEQFLTAASEIASKAAAIPGPVGIAGGIASIAFGAAAAFARAGRDPLGEIERILSADPELAKVRAGWRDLIAHEWSGERPAAPPVGRPKTDPPPAFDPVQPDPVPPAAGAAPIAPDTLEDESIYDDDEPGTDSAPTDTDEG